MAVISKDIYCQKRISISLLYLESYKKVDSFHLDIFTFHLIYLSKQHESHVCKALYFTNKVYE